MQQKNIRKQILLFWTREKAVTTTAIRKPYNNLKAAAAPGISSVWSGGKKVLRRDSSP